jgi:hypothetical protein
MSEILDLQETEEDAPTAYPCNNSYTSTTGVV